MTIHKGRLGEPERDLSPVRGAEAVSLATRLTIESFGLAGRSSVPGANDRVQVRFVPRVRA